MKKIAALGVLMSLWASLASAQSCTAVPNTLTNGTTADATQVMENFNSILACIGNLSNNGVVLRGYLGGLTMSNDLTTPNTVIDTVAGVADSDDVTTLMTIPAFTKNANAAWAVGAGGGCLDTGTALAANTWYNLFVIERADTNVVDELCSTSVTVPLMPPSYSKKRRIGSFKTDSNGHILAFSQNGDEFLWGAAITDVNAVSLGINPTLFQLSVPPGVKVVARIEVLGSNTSQWFILVNSPDQAPTATNVPLGNETLYSASGVMLMTLDVRTNTTQSIRAVASLADTVFYIATYGWIDTRGRFN